MDLETVAQQLEEIKKSISSLSALLTSKEGVLVEQASMKEKIIGMQQKIKDLPTPSEIKIYALIGSGSMAFLVLFGYIIYKTLTRQ